MSVEIPDQFSSILNVPEVTAEIMRDDGTYPNNEALPLLVYSHSVSPDDRSPAQALEEIFRAHDWTGAWRNGIFSYHHYHSTSHEVLGVARGRATVKLGGPGGIDVEVTAGDVLVLPAGVAHKNCGASSDFLVVGAYPQGRSWDLKKGAPGERPEADQNIRNVPRPAQDPVYGMKGPLQEYWTAGE